MREHYGRDGHPGVIQPGAGSDPSRPGAIRTATGPVVQQRFREREWCGPILGVVPGVITDMIGHVSPRVSLSNDAAPANRRPRANRDVRRHQTVVLPTACPTLSSAAARALLLILLDANAQKYGSVEAGSSPHELARR